MLSFLFFAFLLLTLFLSLFVVKGFQGCCDDLQVGQMVFALGRLLVEGV